MPRLPIAEIIGALSKTPVEEQIGKSAEQLAKETPEIAQHLPDVPFAGEPALKPYVRATSGPPEGGDVGALVQKVKRGMGGFVQAEPNLPKMYQDMILDARYKVENAQTTADKVVVDRVVKKLQGDVMPKSRLMSDYLTLADEFADLSSKFAKDPETPVYGRGGATIDQIERSLHAVTGEVQKHPDVVQAIQGFRNVTDELFQDMVNYGLIAPNRYRKDWTPRQQIMEIARGMSDAYGEHSVGGEVLSTMERRTLTGGVTETNMVGVLRKVLKEFHEKRAGDDLVLRVLADPAMNRTEEFALKPGELLPKGWTMYRPRPGLPGWKIPEADAHFAAGVADHLGADAKSLVPGSFVIPEDMAQRLENFYPEHPRPGVESTVYKMGRATARAFTVYNPANTAMNLVSDFGLATLGLPGEKNNLRGFLRFYPQALGESIKGAFGGNSALYERGVQEGLGSATYIEATGGAQVPASLAEALGETPSKNPFSHAANVLRRSRMAVEMAPRLAAGMAAEARTGAASEFGRVGRNITLPYGAGAPEHTRSPFFRFAAPFMQFIGLATDRTAKLLTMKGSRGRAWAAVVAVPTAAFMWNRQNQAFRDVEMSLNKRDRYTMHVIVPGEDGAPAHDVNGKPIVLRFRYFVPEEVAGMFGLSNIPARVADLVEGRATVGDLAASSAATAIEQAGSQVVPAQIAVGLATGRNLQTGQAVPRAEIAANAIPIVRQGLEAVKQTENEGVVGGIKSLVEGASAVRFDTPVKKGRADADIEDLKVKLKDERTMMRSSFRKGDRATGMQHQRNIYKIANRIRAINAARRKGRSKR